MVSDPVPRRSGESVRIHNVGLGMLVIYAYSVGNAIYQLVDQNGVLDSDTMFDIDAIAPGAVSEGDLRVMFQTLLEERFKLKVHWETRELAGYELVIAKGGLRMKPTSSDNEIAVNGHSFPSGTSTVFIGTDHVAHLIGKGASMAQLLYQLTGRLRTPIEDRTGLTGIFDYDVTFALNAMQADANSAPVVTTAIREELGLRLEKSRIPIKVLIIDHAEKPTAN
jgi:uncharacterized protein (TIGR03435 family)